MSDEKKKFATGGFVSGPFKLALNHDCPAAIIRKGEVVVPRVPNPTPGTPNHLRD